jgi:hypothetical protein
MNTELHIIHVFEGSADIRRDTALLFDKKPGLGCLVDGAQHRLALRTSVIVSGQASDATQGLSDLLRRANQNVASSKRAAPADCRVTDKRAYCHGRALDKTTVYTVEFGNGDLEHLA